MKYLVVLLLLCFGPSNGQNLYTNEPDIVYPILEEFIAENFKNKINTFAKLNEIDSIQVVWLDYPLYGLHIKKGNHHTIKIHKWLLQDPRRFERTLKHELGHVFNLKHITSKKDSKDFLELMSDVHYEEVSHYYKDNVIWQQVNSNYYKSLQKSIK